MIPALILLGLVVAFFGGGCLLGVSKRDSVGDGLGITIMCLAPIGILLILILWASFYFPNMNAIARMEAFQEATLDTYLETIKETEGVTIDRSIPFFVDIAYQEQSKVTSMRIMELRNAIAEYNKMLKQKRALKGTPFGVFMPDIPEELQLITLEINGD